MSTLENNGHAWWVGPAVANPRLRLFCLPPAGGGALYFREWAREFGDGIEVRALQLPGRESRLREKPLRDMAILLEQLLPALETAVRIPYAIFGHSMGALVGFELARRLVQTGALPPRALIVAGRRAPHLPPSEAPLHELGDDALWTRLFVLEGIPEGVYREPELKGLLLPMIRADLELIELHHPAGGEPLTCPVAAFGGKSDPMVRSDEVEAWKETTTGEFSAVFLPGGHHFVQSARQELLMRIQELLQDPR